MLRMCERGGGRIRRIDFWGVGGWGVGGGCGGFFFFKQKTAYEIGQ